jgi:hypothetical protein
LIEVSNIVVTGLFGTDPATAINGPQNGSFIVAIAGSNGRRATASGAVFTFNVKGLQVGQTAIGCRARVSKGDGTLTDITAVTTTLTILGITPTPTFTSTATRTITPTSTPTTTPTTTPTSTPTLTPTTTRTSTPTLTPTTPPLPAPILAGQVIASKPVTVSLYRADNSLVTSVTANANGTFSLTAAAGSYTVVARASGFLSAQGPVTLTAGQTTTKPTISLIAGDIDGNGVIDQFDAMTIGMSYNTATPAAADLNNDGVINVLDLEILADNYRASGALNW